MTGPNRGAGPPGRRDATLRARLVIDELVAAGLTDLCIAPGSRSTPLVLAAVRHSELRARVFIDERSAAFFALGLGRATGRPAAIVTTSGTAVANLFPAVVEACQGEVPLLLVTADRPPRLRGADANQAIDQLRIFGDYVRFHADLVGPLDRSEEARHLRTTVGRAWASAAGWPAGPVHLNVPFDKPLEPGSDEPDPLGGGRARGRGEPWVRVHAVAPRAPDDALDDLARRLAAARRPVVVAGPSARASEVGRAARALAGAGGFPLLADPLSGGRYGPDTVAVPVHYDLTLRDAHVREALEPDFVLRVGLAPTSAALLGWLSSLGHVPQVVIDAGPRFKDHLAVAEEYCVWDAADAMLRLAERLSRDLEAWPALWRAVDGAAATALAMLPADPSDEGRLMAEIVRAIPGGTPLFVSSSMPVRDLDAFGGAHEGPLTVFGNRGASGIDGIVSTALGVAAGAGQATVAVLGDLALLHDVNGLLAAREPDVQVVFVVVNNDGGGIFHFLPVRDHEPAFTPYFATPHGIDLSNAAALYGVEHRRVDSVDELAAAVREALYGATSVVLEVRTDRDENRRAHERAADEVARASREALDGVS